MSVSIYQVDLGKWRADVSVKGLRKSKVTRIKADAKTWARDKEIDLIKEHARIQALGSGSSVTLHRALDEYSKKVSAKKSHGDQSKSGSSCCNELCHILTGQ